MRSSSSFPISSRKLFYLGRWLEHGGWFPEWRIRLFRRAAGRWVGIDPHDTVEVEGMTGRIPPGGKGTDAAVIGLPEGLGTPGQSFAPLDAAERDALLAAWQDL